MLRVRNLNKYEDIRSIQQHYHDLGIQFKRKTKKFTDASGIIQLEKFFYLVLWEMVCLLTSRSHTMAIL